MSFFSKLKSFFAGSTKPEIQEIPHTDNVLRIIRGTQIEERADGSVQVNGSAFVSRPRDNGRPSYNWLDYFQGTKEKRIESVRARLRLRVRKSWRYIELNCGQATEALNTARTQLDGVSSSMELDPLKADEKFIEDPSHCVMTNIPAESDLFADVIGDILAERVIAAHPIEI